MSEKCLVYRLTSTDNELCKISLADVQARAEGGLLETSEQNPTSLASSILKFILARKTERRDICGARHGISSPSGLAKVRCGSSPCVAPNRSLLHYVYNIRRYISPTGKLRRGASIYHPKLDIDSSSLSLAWMLCLFLRSSSSQHTITVNIRYRILSKKLI
jgi:hypothetical protein